VIAYVPGFTDTQPIAPMQEEEPEPAPAPTFATPTASAVEAVSAPIAEPKPAIAEKPESTVMHAIEAAAAAAVAGVAATVGVAHILHPESPAEEPVAHIATPEPEIHEAAPAIEEHRVTEPIGDAALAEELAAALARKETDEPATHGADSIHSDLHAAVHEPVSHSVQGITDNKLADAVARAFENLKPQLITEIIKELMR
jgi:hypothetical protein